MGIGGGGQLVVDHLERGLAVVVVGIDYRKGCAVDGLPGAEHRMGGAPGLDPAFGDGKSLGQIRQFLVGVANLHGSLLQTLADGFQEVLLDGFLDDNHNGVEAGLMGIINGIIQNGLALTADRVDLLQSAVAAAHTGGQNHKNRFLCHRIFLLCVLDVPSLYAFRPRKASA